MNSLKWILLITAAAGLILAGCEGDEGPAGPEGPEGPPGSGFVYTYPGDVSDAAGAVGADQLVLLKALDAGGNEIADLSSTLTQDDGTFAMPSMLDATATAMGLRAIVGEQVLRAFLVDVDGQSVSPVTEGVFDLITMVTGPAGGRTLDDYTAAEIRTLTTAAAAALTTAGTDLDDAAAVRQQLLTDIGGQLADLSGGVVLVEPSGVFVTSDPADVLTDVASFNVEFTDGDGELWDIEGSGAISDGTYDTYDSMFELTVGGASFPYYGAPSAEARIEDGREVVLGPVVDLGGHGLNVTRKIYVPETGSFARFAEILYNPGAADVDIDVLISGNMGSDESTDDVHYSSNGNTSADEGDLWLTMKWDSDPTAGFFFPGAVPAKYEDDVEYGWSTFTVPAGETVILYHWAFQSSTDSPAVMADRLAQLEIQMTLDLFTGLTRAEAAAGLYLIGPPNVVGEAGAVAPLATVQLENQISGTTATTTAAGDGSFAVYLKQTAAGDTVHVTASDGSDETVTAQ